jgi:putative transcriptional regulator
VASGGRIGNRIRRLRFDSDEMTQEELATRTGCTRQTIIALEQGKYVPSIELAFRIARTFHVSLEEVFLYEESKPE